MSPSQLLCRSKKPFACNRCHLLCANAETLKKHIAKEHMWSPITCFQCNICQEIYKEQDEVIDHIVQYHYHSMGPLSAVDLVVNPSAAAAPHEQKEKVGNNNDLSAPTRAETAPCSQQPAVGAQERIPELKCPHCPKSFAESPGLEEHVKSAHLTERCPHCPQAFPTQTRLKMHLVRSHKVIKKELGCPMCPLFSCSTQESLRKHITENHLDNGQQQQQGEEQAGQREVKPEPQADPSLPEKCPHCDKRFSYQRSLQSHLKTAHSAAKCPYCVELAKDSSSLRDHIQLKHPVGQAPAAVTRCPLCTEGYRGKEALKRHMSLAHPAPASQRPGEFKCSRCNDASFPSRHLLDVHNSFSHTLADDRDEASSSQCPICEVTVPETEMKAHIRTSHPLDEAGESDGSASVSSLAGSFKCDLCDRVCRSQENLDRHRKRRHKAAT